MKTLRYRGVPVVGFAGYSGSGKTTLMQNLIPELNRAGLRPAIVKHAHHEFDIDHPGKDSHVLRKAGAAQVLVGSAHRVALISETGDGIEANLPDFLARLDLTNSDIILVEGFRDLAFPKIEIYRTGEDRQPFYEHDEFIIALVTDDPAPGGDHLPAFRPHDTAGLAEFLGHYCRRAVSCAVP